MDATERDDDFASKKILVLTADPGPHADGAATVEQKPGHEGVADDAEIVTPPRIGIEIANRRRGAPQRPVAHRHSAIAVAKIVVHVGDERHLTFLRES